MWKIPFFSQNDLNSAFSNSVPWSLLIEEIINLFQFELFYRIFKDLERLMLMSKEVYPSILEYSSTKTKP